MRRASESPTFEGASLLLGQIEMKQIEDPDLASFFSIAKEFAEFCSEVGIPRDAKVNIFEIVTGVDYASILAKLIDRGVQNAPGEASRLVARALKLKARIPLYSDLDRRLAERFGLAPPPRDLAMTVEGCAGRYVWQTEGRTIDFDLKSDGTFTAVSRPDEPSIENLIRDGKGTWKIENHRLTVSMTHVWVGVYWKEFPATWIPGTTLASASERELRLSDGNVLRRK